MNNFSRGKLISCSCFSLTSLILFSSFDCVELANAMEEGVETVGSEGYRMRAEGGGVGRPP